VADGLLPAVPPELMSGDAEMRWLVEEQDGQPVSRRLAGIDLGIASRHSVRVLGADGQAVCRSSCVPAVESLAAVERAALAGAPEGTRLAVVFEPTGPAWMPIAVFFAGRGHGVYRVSSAKAAGLRRFLRRHAKPNGIDAETLARMPLAGPGGLQQLELPGADAAALDRRVRACERLTRAASEHKVRIKDLVRQLMPMTPLTGDLGQAGLAILERYAGPRVLLDASAEEVTRLITSTSNKQQGQERAQQWRAAAAAAIELYGDHPAVPYAELAAEAATEVRLLRAIQGELALHAAAREQRYLQVDPGQLARSLPGFAEISAPVLTAAMGRPGRFRNRTRFKSCAGLAPRASQTGQTGRKDQPMSKAGPFLLRATLFRAAGTARRQDPQLARIYYQQMTERGATHLKACCVVAGHLAERAWTVLNRGTPYVICGNNGNPVTPEQAKQIIAAKWTVPVDVRKRRRSRKKAGKAPQAATTGPDKRGGPPRPRSSRPPTQAVNPATARQPQPPFPQVTRLPTGHPADAPHQHARTPGRTGNNRPGSPAAT
jgi:transposase